MHLMRYMNKIGDLHVLDYEIRIENKKPVVYFIKTVFTDNNKWNEQQVLSDVFVKRCVLAEAYINLDNKGIKIAKYINDNLGDLKIIKRIEKISDTIDEIAISLPTSVCPNKRNMPTTIRAFKNSFLPLLVDINGEDASRFFQDFDMFGSKAVNVAYDALIDGKRPNVENDMFDFYQIGFLRNKIFGSNITDLIIEK